MQNRNQQANTHTHNSKLSIPSAVVVVGSAAAAAQKNDSRMMEERRERARIYFLFGSVGI
jgi:hypothetical protein